MSRNSFSRYTTFFSWGLILALFLILNSAFAETIFLSPQRVVELAQKQSIAVKASEYTVNAEKYALKSAVTAFLPTVSANASATHFIVRPQMEMGDGGGDIGSLISDPIDTSGMDIGDWKTLALLGKMFSGIKIAAPDNFYSVGISAGLPLFTGGKILNSYRMAKHSLNTQTFSHERRITEIALTAQQIFWGYINILKGYESLHETRQWFETLIDDQQKMFENDLIIELDVLNSKLQRDNFKLAEEKTRNLIKTTGGQLLMFLGLPPEAHIEPDTSALHAPDAVFVEPTADSIENSINNREDVKALSSRLEMLYSLKKLQMGSYAPTVAAFASFGYNNQYSTSETEMKQSTSIGLSLDWTLLDWGKTSFETRKIECQIQALKLQYDNLRNSIRLKLMELSRKVDESRKATVIAREDVGIAAKALEIARKKYDAQLITNTELLTSRNQLTNKMLAYSQARITALLAYEEFKAAPLSSAVMQ